jgi:hypothetical protein
MVPFNLRRFQDRLRMAGILYLHPMIRVALFSVAIVTVVGATVLFAAWSVGPVETPIETITSRFPAEWEAAPVVVYRKPQPLPSTLSRMSSDEFIGALAAIERLRPAPRPSQPADAVFNEAQIASIKARLQLKREQEPYWRNVEASLRQIVWDRSRRDRPRVEANSLERLKEAAAPFVTTLNAKQQSEIRTLANIVGLKLNHE